MRRRPLVEGLEQGQLCLRLYPDHIDPELREHVFNWLDLPRHILEKLATVDCISLRLKEEGDFSHPVMAPPHIGFEFGGYQDCNLVIGLTPEHTDALRKNGAFYFEIPSDIRPRFIKIKTFHLQLIFESISAPSEKKESTAPALV